MATDDEDLWAPFLAFRPEDRHAARLRRHVEQDMKRGARHVPRRAAALLYSMTATAGCCSRETGLGVTAKPPPGGTDAFYKRLMEHGTYIGPGHWFEMPDTCFRVGYGWPTSEELAAGLAAISAALRG